MFKANSQRHASCPARMSDHPIAYIRFSLARDLLTWHTRSGFVFLRIEPSLLITWQPQGDYTDGRVAAVLFCRKAIACPIKCNSCPLRVLKGFAHSWSSNRDSIELRMARINQIWWCGGTTSFWYQVGQARWVYLSLTLFSQWWWWCARCCA